MGKIGILFGTNSGTTRLMAKKLARKLGEDLVGVTLNVNRATPEAFMQYDSLILGTPTYGDGQLPSESLGAKDGAWQEFLVKLDGRDFSGKTIALYGLGDQVKYGAHFAGGMAKLRDFFRERGARFVGQWSTDGYEFQACEAVEDGRFCGLVVDTANQPLLTDQRLDTWVELIRAPLVEAMGG